MDETLLKELKDTILKAINSGLAFPHMTEFEREQQENSIIEHLKTKGYEAFVEECMIYVLGNSWEKVLMMELTRNTLYFTPFNPKETSVVIYYILQLVSKRYLDKMPKEDTKVSKQKEEIEDDSEEDTEEEPKPPPNFDFL